MPTPVKIDRIENASRTILMVADFLHREPTAINPDDKLREDWNMTNDDLEVLELWIEGPISRTVEGFFQDVAADVSVADLQNPKIVKTVSNLATLIWKSIPAANKAP